MTSATILYNGMKNIFMLIVMINTKFGQIIMIWCCKVNKILFNNRWFPESQFNLIWLK